MKEDVDYGNADNALLTLCAYQFHCPRTKRAENTDRAKACYENQRAKQQHENERKSKEKAEQ